MTRITKDMADSIARNAANTQFKKRRDDMVEQESVMGMELYASLFDINMDNGKSLLKAVQKVPSKWIRQDGCLRFNCNGYHLTFRVKKEVPVPYSSNCSNLGSVSADLGDKAQDFARAKEALNSEYNQAQYLTKKMIESCGTIAKLQKTWPEGNQFYARYIDMKTGAALPVVQVAEINKALGL